MNILFRSLKINIFNGFSVASCEAHNSSVALGHKSSVASGHNSSVALEHKSSSVGGRGREGAFFSYDLFGFLGFSFSHDVRRFPKDSIGLLSNPAAAWGK